MTPFHAFRGAPAALVALLIAGCASSHAAVQPPQAVAPEPSVPPPVTQPSPRVLLRTMVDSLIAAPEFRNAHWGILVIDPDHGDTLYSHNAGKLFMPASNMKIVTGSVALSLLGPDFRFRTTFVAGGPVCHGVLEGDLIVDGRGDPSISDSMRVAGALSPLRDIADSLRARGIDRIAGRVVRGTDAFPASPLGYGWSWDDLGYAYGAGVDELFFNEGAGRIVVGGGARVGARVTAAVLPATGYPALRITARTALAPEPAVGSGGRLSENGNAELTTHVDSATGAIVIDGWIAPQTVDTLDFPYPDQDAAYLAALRTAFVAQGVRVSDGTPRRARCGRAVTAAAAVSTTQDTLLVYQSAPLRDVLHAMLKPSQNQIAEILLRTIALERTGAGIPDSGIAVVKRQLLDWGVAPDGFVLHDGSGLSRYDYVTPETLARVLATIRRDTAFSAFYDGLPIAGVDGTIAHRMRDTPAQGNVHAKTGLIANARSLSGYVTTADGRQLIFVALCNNYTVRVRDVERVQDAVAVTLASMRLGGNP